MSLADMERRAGVSNAPPEEPKKDGDKKGPGWGLFAVLVLLAGGGVAVYMFVIEPRIDKYRLVHQHGKAAGSVIENGLLTTIDWLDISKSHKDVNDQDVEEQLYKTRITSVDLTTGKQLGQVLIEGSGNCVSATPDTLWCNFGGLELYDRKTLKKLADVEDAIKKAKIGATPLRDGVGKDKDLVGMIAGGKVTLLVDDGRVAVFDAATQKVTKLDDVPKELAGQTISGMQVQRPPTLKLTPITSCTIASATGFGRSKVTAGKLTSKETYLAPAVVGTLDPPLFVHHSSMDDKEDSLQLARLDASGGTAWTVDLGGACEQMSMIAGHVVIATKNPEKRAIAVDAQSGAVAWKVGF